MLGVFGFGCVCCLWVWVLLVGFVGFDFLVVVLVGCVG